MVANASLKCTNCSEGMTVQYAAALKPAQHHVEPQCPVCRDPAVIQNFIAQFAAKNKRHVILVRITY